MTTAFVKGLLLCQWDCSKIELDFFSSRTYDEHKGYVQGTRFNCDSEWIIFKVHPSGLYNTFKILYLHICVVDYDDIDLFSPELTFAVLLPLIEPNTNQESNPKDCLVSVGSPYHQPLLSAGAMEGLFFLRDRSPSRTPTGYLDSVRN